MIFRLSHVQAYLETAGQWCGTDETILTDYCTRQSGFDKVQIYKKKLNQQIHVL